jgi:hypothetical protein
MLEETGEYVAVQIQSVVWTSQKYVPVPPDPRGASTPLTNHISFFEHTTVEDP